jgi:hypothetical protein
LVVVVVVVVVAVVAVVVVFGVVGVAISVGRLPNSRKPELPGRDSYP